MGMVTLKSLHVSVVLPRQRYTPYILYECLKDQDKMEFLICIKGWIVVSGHFDRRHTQTQNGAINIVCTLSIEL